MVKLRPFLYVNRFPNFRLKMKMGVLLLCLSFLFNYQPQLGFPPIKSNLAYAEITQQPEVAAEDLGVTFQLPHDGYITTTFSSYHPGIDLCTGLGMPIKPIAKGVVVSAGYTFFGLGLVVEVDHQNGYKSLYAHMGKIYVEPGKEVNENSFLGEVGMTGNTSGPHTHLEVFKNGTKIDPRLILPEIRNYPKSEDFVTIQSATPSAVAIPVQTTEPASASATPKAIPTPTATPTAIPSPSSLPLENVLFPEIKPEASPEPDITKQALNNVLSIASPKPVSAPLPQGGQISLKNFSLLAFKKF